MKALLITQASQDLITGGLIAFAIIAFCYIYSSLTTKKDNYYKLGTTIPQSEINELKKLENN
jgi:phage-related holin